MRIKKVIDHERKYHHHLNQCLNCEQFFYGHRPVTLFCSVKCNRRYWYVQNRESHLKYLRRRRLAKRAREKGIDYANQ